MQLKIAIAFFETEINDDASKETVELRELSKSSLGRVFQVKKRRFV